MLRLHWARRLGLHIYEFTILQTYKAPDVVESFSGCCVPTGRPALVYAFTNLQFHEFTKLGMVSGGSRGVVRPLGAPFSLYNFTILQIYKR